jgi:putative Mg2+ transporter-C (MgtC) family protein
MLRFRQRLSLRLPARGPTERQRRCFTARSVNIRGLNTAATLWCSAAVGAAAGAGFLAEAALLTGLAIAGNMLLRPLVNAINRIPLDEQASEATYNVRVAASPERAAEARESLVEALEAAHYPVAEVETSERGDELVDVVATLVATSVVAAELDAITTRMAKEPGVAHATWESSATA